MNFYYQRTVHGLFRVFDRKDPFHAVFLWHYYEELEHHQESTYFYTEYYGLWRFVVTPLALPVALALHLLIHSFACAYALLYSPWLHKVPIVIAGVWDYVYTVVVCVLSTFMLMFRITSSEAEIKRDLALFASMYEDRFGILLTDSDIVIGVTTGKKA